MVMVRFAVAFRLAESLTLTVTVVFPGAAVRLPEMMPVVALIESEAGSGVVASVVQVNGATPPVTSKSAGVSEVYC